MYSMHEPLYKVIAREAYSQNKCYKCFNDLKIHKRCSICNTFLMCSKENICTDCKGEGVFFSLWKKNKGTSGGKKRKGFRKNKSLDTELD